METRTKRVFPLPNDIPTLVIVTIIVKIVIKLFAYWLDNHKDNQK